MAKYQEQAISFDVEANRPPIALVIPVEQEAVLGNLVRLDGRASTDPEGAVVTFTWSFVEVPIGSQVEAQGFTLLDPDASVVSFAPDLVGRYKVKLVVNDGSLDSLPSYGDIDTRLTLVPNNKGLVPDANWIWNFLSNFWNLVPDKAYFTTFWSSAIQIGAGELLTGYQIDYSKSIRDIQPLFQRRWLHYDPSLYLSADKVRFILAEDQAGLEASTSLIDPKSGLPIEGQGDYSSSIIVPIAEGSFTTSPSTRLNISKNRVIQLGERSFTLARSGSVSKAVTYGQDGQVVDTAGTFTFKGSGFADGTDWKDYILHVLSGPDKNRDFVIDYVSGGTVGFENSGTTLHFPVGTTFLSEETNIKYTITPKIATHSVFFSDTPTVPTRLTAQTWRFSSTLISDEYNFELNGVSPGDVLEVEIKRKDIDFVGFLNAQVVSVDRNKVGIVLNTDALEDGQPAPGIALEDQISLAPPLRVVGLLKTYDGRILYTNDASQIYQTVRSLNFRRSYYERELTPSEEIDVGFFSMTVTPIRIIRNSKIRIDDRINSIPVLQEFIKRPDITTINGILTQVTEARTFNLRREPFTFLENLDYVIDDDSTITGVCTVIQGLDLIEINGGDLIDRGVSEGDSIEVTLGVNLLRFTIIKVLGSETLRVTPFATVSGDGVFFKIIRKVYGKFIRFVKNSFSPKLAAPNRLWAEVTYFDNSESIERNFGSLVGVKAEDLKNINSDIPYKEAVNGLMYSLVQGTTVSNLELSAQILFGLPFAINAGTILEIDSNYRVRDDGSPLTGRIVVQAENAKGVPIGSTDIYLFPHGRQLTDPDNPGSFLAANPDFSGLSVNPETGVEYVAGDKVSKFAILSKGVKVEEYNSSSDLSKRLFSQGNVGSAIDKYHTFSLLINANFATSYDIDFLAEFINKAKPHHTKMRTSLLAAQVDQPELEVGFWAQYGLGLFDAPAMGLPMAIKFDGTGDLSLLTVEGKMYAGYIFREDIQTTKDSSIVVSPTGGFLEAGTQESHDTPFLQSGDLVNIISGPNEGFYPVTSIINDNQIDLNLGSTVFETLHRTVVDGATDITGLELTSTTAVFTNSDVGKVVVALGEPVALVRAVSGNTATIFPPWSDSLVGVTFSIQTTQPCVVFREIKNPIWSGTVSFSGTPNDLLQILTNDGAALYSSGVTAGDSLILYGAGISKLYKVANINPISSPPSVSVSVPISESPATYNAIILRERLLPKYFLHSEADTPHTVSYNSGTPLITFDLGLSDVRELGFLRPGDIIKRNSVTYEVLEWRHTSLQALVIPTPTLTEASVPATVYRPSKPDTVISSDLAEHLTEDVLELRLSYGTWTGVVEPVPDLLTTASSAVVSSSVGTDFDFLGILRGDFLHIVDGPDSLIDYGYGPGVFVILDIQAAGLQLVLGALMTSTSPAPGVRYTLRRQAPNEGNSLL